MKINIKPKKALKRVLLVDADVFVYQAVMDNLREVCIDDEYQYTLQAGEVQDAIETRMDEMQRELQASDVFLAFGSLNNWRKKLLPEYKAHRTTKKPLGYWKTIEWCLSKWEGKQVPFLEADDIIGVLATCLTYRSDFQKIVVSEDKDLDTVPGMHWNPRQPEQGLYNITVEEAARNHLFQTLCGDAADGYKGCPGIGKVTAAEVLSKNKLDMWGGVVQAFKDAKLTEEDALVQARVAHILTSEYCDLETGTVKYWTPPGRKPARGNGARPAVVRRVARAIKRSA